MVISQNGPFNYSWVGPQTFVSTDAMPMIPNATAANNGTYTVKVYDKYGCMSEPKSTVVSIQDPPVTPTLTGEIAARVKVAGRFEQRVRSGAKGLAGFLTQRIFACGSVPVGKGRQRIHQFHQPRPHPQQFAFAGAGK